ncbi:hypothetical protein D3C72_1587950 [compost metagenome]
MQALIRGNGENRRANDVELPGLHRDFINKHRRDDDPGDWPQSVEETIHHRRQGVIDRHFVEEQRHHQRNRDGVGGGEIALQLELNQREEEEQNR